jgi:hypothetical protein
VKVGFFEIDFIINDELVLEVNGRPHLFYHDDNLMTESTVSKIKALKAFGYEKFAVISPKEWRAVDGNAAREKALLSKIIKSKLEGDCEDIL